MDGVDSVLNMAKFVPLVISCRKSMVIKTRMISARAVVPLVSGDLIIQTLQKLLFSLSASKSDELKQNHIHGTLLHVYHLLTGHVHGAGVCIKKQIVSDILPQLKHSAWLGTRCNPCALTRAVFLDIVLHFVVDWSWLDHADTGNSELMALAKRDLQPLKQWFENIAIEETTGKQVAGAVIGEVFVRKAVAGICLRTCEEYKPCHESDDPQMITKYSEVIHTLLHSVEYEVRSAVLEFIICQQLPSELNTRLDCEITPHTPDSRTASWIFGELESQNLKTQLLTMAMETEHHVDCLVKVFQVLFQLPNVLSFPWTLSSGRQISAYECWVFVAGLINAPSQRDTLKDALLKFLSRMVTLMHGLVSNKDSAIASQARNALTDFSRILLETSSPSNSIEMRLCTAQVLGHMNATEAMFDTHGTLGDVPFDLWSVVIKLLSDDEPVVREQMALGFSFLLKRIQTSSLVVGCPLESCAMVPPKSLESVMLCVWCLFIHRAPVACVSWMLELIRGDLTYESCDQGDDMSDVDRLFEKGPLNIYAEECIVTRIACQTVKQGIGMNDGTVLLTLEKHQTELIELLKEQLEKCLVFLESFLSTNCNLNRNVFGLLYRAFAGLCVIVMLTYQLHGNISAVQSRIIAIVRAVKKPSNTEGISFHSMIKDCVENLRTFITL